MKRSTLMLGVAAAVASWGSMAPGQTRIAGWKPARIWVAGAEKRVWLLAANAPEDNALPTVRFWYAGEEDALAAPRLRHTLPPVSGDPRLVGADAAAIRILFSDLTNSDYDPAESMSPGAPWLGQCRTAPICWTGDAAEPVFYALAETRALAPLTTTPSEPPQLPDNGGRPPDSAAGSTDPETISETRGPADSSVEPSRVTLLKLRAGRWRRIPGPRAADAGERFWLAARGGIVRLFWTEDDRVQTAAYENEEWTDAERVLERGAPKYAWAGATEDGPVFLAAVADSDDTIGVRFWARVGTDWVDRGLLRDGTDYLALDPDRDDLALARGRIALARLDADGGIMFGEAELTDWPLMRFQALSFERDDPRQEAQWQEAISLALGLAVLSFIVWSRREAMARPLTPPQGFVLSSVWRRALATLLDAGPAVLLMMPWAFRQAAELSPPLDLSEAWNRAEDPAVREMMLPVYYACAAVYGGWCLIWELLIATTPGKFLFSCRVVNIDGARPNLRQIVARNVVRTLMVGIGSPGLIITLMTMVLLTRNRQRVGDLLADTLVIEPAPPTAPSAGDEPPEAFG